MESIIYTITNNAKALSLILAALFAIVLVQQLGSVKENHVSKPTTSVEILNTLDGAGR